MWKEGSLRVNGDIFHYWMKQYGEGSQWGINGGRISKLMLKRNGEIVYNFDRGEDVAPVDENTAFALEILLHSENYYYKIIRRDRAERLFLSYMTQPQGLYFLCPEVRLYDTKTEKLQADTLHGKGQLLR